MPVAIALLLTMSALPAGEFTTLQSRVSDASFPKDKMKIIKRLPKTATLSCAQTVALVNTFSFAKDKVALIAYLTPRIDDLANRHLIIDALTFSGDKEEAGEILDRAYAEQEDARHAKVEEAQAARKARAEQRAREIQALRAMSHKKQIKELKAWSERLSAREERLTQRERSVTVREQALARREQALARREARLHATQKASVMPANHRATKPKQQSLSWIGYCPQGINPKRVAKGACHPFDAASFNPTNQYGQRMMLKVKQAGSVTFTIESGPKLRRCKAVGNRKTSATETVKTTRPNQVIDLSEIIDTWDVDYINVVARSKGQKTTMRIDDWQGCER